MRYLWLLPMVGMMIAGAEPAPTTTNEKKIKREEKPAPPAPSVSGSQHAVATEREKVNSAEITLRLTNGHIGEVIIGCRDGATDGFDRQIDDMAPPPGIGGVGYTFLVSPDRKFNLYKDIRAFGESVQWLFYAKLDAKPVTIDWTESPIPQGWDLYCTLWDGKTTDVGEIIDCAKTKKLTLTKTTFVRFWIHCEAQKPQTAESPEVKKTPVEEK